MSRKSVMEFSAKRGESSHRLLNRDLLLIALSTIIVTPLTKLSFGPTEGLSGADIWVQHGTFSPTALVKSFFGD
jgi:hypothetical protein